VSDSSDEYELCLAVVKEQGWALACVPEEYRTPELCHIAVQNDRIGSSLRHVPVKYKTPEFLLKVAFKSDDIILHFQKKLPTNLDFNLVKYLL
jgi:hypothetical protein